MTKGYIHSKESFGTVDGPGVRYVLFMQGCPMRCLYCHNPDTWQSGVGTEITPDEVISEFEKNRPFYKGGGITVTGGEPLMQIDFLIELFRLAKAHGIHTAIDTSGATYNEKNGAYVEKLDELMKYTDLMMLDIKHIDSKKHEALTGKPNENILAFARYLEKKEIPLWVRHVIVKGYTDNPEDLYRLGEFIGTLKNLTALDVLPYHSLGETKYKALGIDYPLSGMPSLSQSAAKAAKNHILAGIRKSREKQDKM